MIAIFKSINWWLVGAFALSSAVSTSMIVVACAVFDWHNVAAAVIAAILIFGFAG